MLIGEMRDLDRRAVPEVSRNVVDRYPRSGAIETAAGAGDGHNTVNRSSWGCRGGN